MNSNNNYIVKIDRVSDSEWSEYLSRFDDASIFQTRAYGTVRWGKNRLSNVIIQKNNDVVGLIQLCIFKIPGTKFGIAYSRYGPVWRRKGQNDNLEKLTFILRTIKNEYGDKRGLLIRIIPNEVSHSNDVKSIYQNAGYIRTKDSYRTIFLNLNPDISSLRRRLTPRWRRQLSISERKGLKIVSGYEDQLFTKFLRLYNEMLERKRYVPGMNALEYREIQKNLPTFQKMRINICEQKKVPVAAIVTSIIGNTCIYLFGATGNQGMKSRGTYLLHWEMIKQLKKRKGARFYDLSGYNPEKNPGTATFKQGFSGVETNFIGEFEYCSSRIRRHFITLTERGNKLIRKMYNGIKGQNRL